ncbi:MAG: 1-acyl-sn-glycerol-3-phosphate acyltransferase [Planctomycetota bacterium]|nr:MAG: 1-acyl-sn-glycerol-3-phosphate acyltransferase [Planctomycetota bacterium]
MSGVQDTAAFDARPGSRLRGALALLPAALFGFAYPAYAILYSIVAPRRFRERRYRMLRCFGRGMLRILGVRVEEHGSEHVRAPGPKLVMFNHVSLLDLFVLASVWPDGGTVLYKKEFHRVPVIGRGMRLMDFIAVDRENRERAFQSIEEAAARVRARGVAVLVAPEGTRSRHGGLQEFKMGPFHLAVATRAPVVPMIQRGIEQLQPMGAWLVRPGRARIDYLEPISTESWTRDQVKQRAPEVRARFLRYLPPAPGTS